MCDALSRSIYFIGYLIETRTEMTTKRIMRRIWIKFIEISNWKFIQLVRIIKLIIFFVLFPRNRFAIHCAAVESIQLLCTANKSIVFIAGVAHRSSSFILLLSTSLPRYQIWCRIEASVCVCAFMWSKLSGSSWKRLHCNECSRWSRYRCSLTCQICE